jgi:isomerase DpgB
MVNLTFDSTFSGASPLSTELAERLTQACDAAERGPGHLTVRVSGTPGDGWADGLTVSAVSRWERAVRRFERLSATTIVAADGVCGGAALDILLAADVRIASPATILELPAAPGGIWPGMAMFRLADQGRGTATVRRAVLFGEPITAAEALAEQLLDQITDDVPAAVLKASTRAATVDGGELARRRQLMSDAGTTSFEEALGVHLAACDRLLRK